MKKKIAQFWTDNRLALLIFLFAFSVRAVLNIVINGFSAPLTADAVGYEELGRNLLAGKGFVLTNIGPTAYRFPLFPMMISALYAIFGQHEFVIRMFLSALDGITCAMIFLLGNKIYSRSAGLFASLVYAVSPFAFGECLQLSTEVPFALFILLMVYFLYPTKKSPMISNTALSGLFLGLASLTRPTSIYLVVFLMATFLLIWKNKKEALKHCLVIGCVFIVLYSPWVIRNTIVFGKLNISGNSTGEVLLGSHNPGVFNDAQRSGSWYFTSQNERPSPYNRNEADWNKQLQTMAKQNIKQNLVKMPLHELNKLKYFWNFIPNLAEGATTPVKTALGTLFFGIFLPFFIWGFRDIQRKDMTTIWTVIVYFNLIALGTYGSIRMRFPINPYVYIIAGNYMLVSIRYIFQKRNH